jgi:hypothetical protein
MAPLSEKEAEELTNFLAARGEAIGAYERLVKIKFSDGYKTFGPARLAFCKP